MTKPLLLLLTLVCLAACARAEYIDKPYKISPPEIYLAPNEIPKCKTNLVDCYFELKEGLEKSNQDKTAIAQFYK